MFWSLLNKRLARHVKNLVTSSAHRHPHRRVSLGFESLEDRWVPSTISPNGLHKADIVHDASGYYYNVVEDGKVVGGSYLNARLALGDPATHGLGFSPDSQHLAWVAQLSNGTFGVFVDGRGLGGGSSLTDVGFSPNSQHYAYYVPVGGASTGSGFAVGVDGPPGAGVYSNIQSPAFTPDSRYFTFGIPTLYGPQTVSIALTNSPPVSGTSTSVVASANQSVYGQSVTFTSTVHGGSGLPTGTVTFVVDGQNLAPIALNGAGQASLTLSTLGVGPHHVSAAFNGGPGFSASQAAAVTETVTPAGSSVSLGTAVNPSVHGQAVTFTATVHASGSAAVTAGSVMFVIDGQNQAPVPVNGSGQASLTLTSLGTGTHTISAIYGGSANFSASPLAVPLTETVKQAGSTTTLVTSPDAVAYGQAVTFKATVHAVAPGAGTPAGSVTFVVDGGTPVPVPLDAGGQAQLTLSSLHAGKHTVNASFIGSPDFLGSSTTVAQSVGLGLSAAALPPATAGETYSTSFSALGGSGNYSYALTSGSLPKGLSLSSGGVLGGTTTVAGSYSFKIMATDVPSGVTGSQTYTLTVNAALTSFTITTPSTATAGIAFPTTITARDAFGNSYSGPVTVAVSAGQAVLPASVQLINGSATFPVVLKTAGSVTLRASAGNIKSTSSPIVVNPGAVASVTISAPHAVTAGSGFSVTITAKDAFGNGYSGSVKLLSSDGQTVTPASVTLTDGMATATVTLKTAHTVVLTAVAAGVGGSSGAITVNPAVTSLSFSAPATATAGTGFPVTLTAKDAFGNGYTGPVTLTSSDGQAVTPATAAFVNGVATFPVVLRTAGSVTLTASAAGLKGSTSPITVSPATAVALSISVPKTATAGAGFGVTITAKDAFGNVATGYNGTVKVYTTDGQPVTPTSVTLSHGSATTTVTLKLAHVIRLSIGDGTVGGVSDVITVNPATADSVVVTVPSKVTAGVGFSVTIRVKDAFGNSCNGPVTLTSSDGQAVMPGSFTVTNGVATVLVTLKKAGSLRLTAAVDGAKGTSDVFTVLGK